MQIMAAEMRLSSRPPLTQPTLNTPPQRVGRNLSSEQIKLYLNRLKIEDPKWKQLEFDLDKHTGQRTLSPAMKRFSENLNSTNQPFMFEVNKLVQDVIRFPSVVQSHVMGTLRGIRYKGKHLFNWLPGIQGHINKLHSVNKDLKTGKPIAPGSVRVRGKTIEIPYHHYQLDKPKSADGQWRLAVFGDPGYRNPTLEANVAGYRALNEQQGHKTDGVILLGDVLYAANQRDKKNSFLKSGDTRLLRTNLYEPYKKFIKEKTPLFYTIGNNDSDMGHENAVLAYLNQPRYYQVSLGNDADLFVLDTASWSATDAERLDKRYNTTRYSVLWEEYATAQQHWLKKVLADSKANFPDRKRIIVNHFPVNSTDDSKKAGYVIPRREFFEGMFKNYSTYGIDGIINGHEHMASAKSVGAYDTLTSLVNEEDTPKPENSIIQITNGCSSHYEHVDLKNAHLKIPTFTQLEANTHRYLKHQPIEAMVSNTGFGLLEFKPKEAWYSQISPPMSNSTFYKGHLLDPGERFDESLENREHPKQFKVHFRLPFVRGSEFSKIAYADYIDNSSGASE